MTDSVYVRTPGGHSAPIDRESTAASAVFIYTIGLALAIVLTATSFWAANTDLLWAPGVPLGLAVLAVAQMGVHLVFFLHITTGPDNTSNVLALAFGILIVILVVSGSLWIMTDLNANMTPPAEMIDMQMGVPLRHRATFKATSIAGTEVRCKRRVSRYDPPC